MVNDSNAMISASPRDLNNQSLGEISKYSDVVHISTARHLKLLALICLCAVTLTACSQPTEPQLTQGKKMTNTKKEVVNLDVSLHSYLDRPIFDAYLNGHDIGLAAGQPHRGAGGLMTGVAVPLGPQVITWRLGGPEGMPGNGDTVKAANQPILSRSGKKMNYLGVHIYPDNTVEVIPEQFWPGKTARGDGINHQWELKHGK